MYLLRGLPGSGKSSLAFSIAHDDSVFRIEADMYFVDKVTGKYNFDADKLHQAHKWCQSKTEDFLELGYDVVVSNTFTTKKELKPYFEIAAKYGIIPQVIVCQNEFKNVHDVPDEALKRMKDRFTYDISSLFETQPETI